MAGAGGNRVGPLKQPRNVGDLALGQAEQARTDFPAIADDIEFVIARLAEVPTRKHLVRVALACFLAGAAFATLASLVFIH
jgi:hypothetical protein